jgi:hypothetical protein
MATATKTTARRNAKKGQNRVAPVTTADAAQTPAVDTATVELNAAVAAGQTGDTGPAQLVAPAAPRQRMGVNPKARTRAYEAGKVIARYGHAAGVQPGMVAAVDVAYAAAVPVESEICLRNAWHAIRGYAEVLGIELPAAPHGVVTK